jgi:hypothetical protein
MILDQTILLSLPRSAGNIVLMCVALVLPTLVGCGPSDAPRLAKAQGVVLLKGKPLANVGVTFFPTGSGPMAIGKTDEKGAFVLMTTQPGDGACVGTHTVAIGAAEEGASEFASTVQIPKKYGMPTTSGLTFEVKDGQLNEFVVELTN